MSDDLGARPVGSFEEFYQREYREVLGLAVVLTGKAVIAEDLAQEAFGVALRQWATVSQMERPGAWVRKVVANMSVSTFRRGLSEAKALLGVTRSALESSIEPETKVDIWREVRRLPRRQSQALALTYIGGLSRSEVAIALGCSEETVKTHLARARHKLASRLSNYGDQQ